MTLAIHHVAINAADPGAVTPIYRAAGFGALTVDGDDAQWIAAPNAFLRIQAAGRAAGADEAARRVCDQGITHVCVQSGDGNQTWAAMGGAGADFIGPPVGLATGNLYVYGRDGGHNVFELEGVPAVPAGDPPWIAHVAWASADVARLADFYERLVGRAVHREGRFANALFEKITGLKDVDVEARWIMADNMIVEMWRYLNPPTIDAQPLDDGAPGYAHVAFTSADLSADLARIADAGIVLAPSAPIAGFESFAGRDPDGNRVVLFAEPPAGHPLSRHSLPAPDYVPDRNRMLAAA